ncbi:hypothetical protein CN326_01680 [Bacillus sp. AFS018417]|nr:hypothetical protein CN326_01680 [Bacillus sp. AFS018417]
MNQSGFYGQFIHHLSSVEKRPAILAARAGQRFSFNLKMGAYCPLMRDKVKLPSGNAFLTDG